MSLPIEPTPVQDFAPPGSQTYLSFDLTQQAGIPVSVNGRPLNLLLLPRADSILVVNADIAEDLDLRPLLFGLGSAAVRDGDYLVTGEVVRVRYNIGQGEAEDGLAIVMDEDIHPEYDGAISFGAIPASLFRLQIGPAGGDETGTWHELTLTGRTRALEEARDYRALDFSHRLSLFQDEITANLKASLYLNLAGRMTPTGELEPFTRLFSNTQPHRVHTLDPALDLGLGTISSILAEVDADGTTPGTPDSNRGDVVTVLHDDRSVA